MLMAHYRVMPDVLRIQAFRDANANVWWCASDDIPGLVSEAATFDGLVERVSGVVPELLAANGVPPGKMSLVFNAGAPAIT